MGSYKGNTKKVMDDANVIAERLKTTDITLTTLMREYNCAYPVIMSAICTRMPKEQYRQIAINRQGRGGVKNRFKKGMRPWNIDNKGVHMSPATEFHKGHLPANHRLKGSETIRIDRNGSKHRHIKVSGKAEGDHKWIPYARYVWEQEYGAIPKGKLIAHKNGDMFDDALDNLTLIERTELFDLMRRNNPKERQKAIRNLKKTCRIKRKDREVGRNFELELKRGKEKQRAVDLKHQQIAEAGIVQFRGPMKTWYECRGCGYEMTPPRPPCPKCGHLAFERIEQPVEYARRHAAANE